MEPYREQASGGSLQEKSLENPPGAAFRKPRFASGAEASMISRVTALYVESSDRQYALSVLSQSMRR